MQRLVGLYSDPGPRGLGSAEAQVLRQLPLDRSEIEREIHRDGCGVIVLTENGDTVCLSWQEAWELGIE